MNGSETGFDWNILRHWSQEACHCQLLLLQAGECLQESEDCWMYFDGPSFPENSRSFSKRNKTKSLESRHISFAKEG